MSRDTLFVGIDPGVTGGVATICAGQLSVYPTPRDTDAYLDLLDRVLIADHPDVRVAVEHVWGRPGDTPTTAFALGASFERALVCCALRGTRPTLVAPQVWQRHHGLGAKMEYRRRKKAHQLRARELWPDQAKRLTLATADAALVAAWHADTSAAE